MFIISMILATLYAVELPPYASDYRFEDFPTKTESVQSPSKPKIDTPRARLFRTQLKRAAEKGPNFAGHFRVAQWGCGTCCYEFAIVNLKSGDVWFPDFAITCGHPMDHPIRAQAGLYYRPDSLLLVAIGSRDEGQKSGVYYYKWAGDKLTLIKTGQELENDR